MDPELIKKHSVGIDGTLYEKYPGFKDKMTSVFKEIYPEKSSSFDLVLAKDGSGMGAAVIAAVAAQSET
jgi:hexokinase